MSFGHLSVNNHGEKMLGFKKKDLRDEIQPNLSILAPFQKWGTPVNSYLLAEMRAYSYSECLALTVGPLELNTLSSGAVVAGMQRYFLATADRLGWSPTSAFHQAKGLLLARIVGKGSVSAQQQLLLFWKQLHFLIVLIICSL